MKRINIFIVIIVLVVGSGFSADIDLKIIKGDSWQVTMDYKINGRKPIKSLIVYRSYVNIKNLGCLDLYEYPITKKNLPVDQLKNSFKDTMIAQNCTYYYYMKAIMEDSSICSSPVIEYTVPDIDAAGSENNNTVLCVNKENYILELRSGRTIIKRYPVSLGGNPHDRKFYYDCKTTPEGKYKITYLKKISAFHKSIGVSYPNNEDRQRYSRARQNGLLPNSDGKIPDIGGSIAIHGGGIGNNWTWGCIAMRNDDIDELFSEVSLQIGTPVLICGRNVKLEDLSNIW